MKNEKKCMYQNKAIAKRICPCISSEHGGDNDLEISGDEILGDGLIKKGKENQLEVAIGDGMEFTIHGDLKNKSKKNKLMNNTKVSRTCI
jgi:voltage-gated sodium channel type II alpha